MPMTFNERDQEELNEVKHHLDEANALIMRMIADKVRLLDFDFRSGVNLGLVSFQRNINALQDQLLLMRALCDK